MKFPFLCLIAGSLASACLAAPLVYEPFDYQPGIPLTAQSGGTGWAAAWLEDGAAAVTATGTLSYTDPLGNGIDTRGGACNTASTTTSRSLRDLANGPLNDVWISFLWNLPSSNSLFEGVSLYRGSQQVVSVSNPSTSTTSNIVLTNNLTGASANSGLGNFNRTHLVVLRLVKGGGTAGADRADLFIDPLLTTAPSSPAATLNGSSFDFDRVRIAGQNGSPLLIDEFRIGLTFDDVTPHSTGPGPDTDGDGLTDVQEADLGLDPNESDAALIAAIRAHADWFGLYTEEDLIAIAGGDGSIVIPSDGADSAPLIFEAQSSEDLILWSTIQTYNRQVQLPDGKKFLRVTPGAP